jgi:hypothetical protein
MEDEQGSVLKLKGLPYSTTREQVGGNELAWVESRLAVN